MDDILAKKNRHLFLEEKDNVGNSFIANVNAVADDLDNVDAVANDLEKIDTVADNIGNVNTVAENIGDINTTVENLSKIDQFNDNLIDLLESLLEQLGEDGNAWLVRLTELGESILATTSAFNYAVTTTLTQDIASGATLTLPEAMKYRVGTHMLMVSWNGTVCYIGDQYSEVGSFGQWSTTITMNVPLKAGDKIQFRVVALADSAAFVGQIDSVIGNASVIATGSTENRTLANRFADIVNVKDFGAKGDGVTDDTVAFNKAVTFANGSNILIPYGSYLISSNITGNFISIDNVSIIGTGSVSVIKNINSIKRTLDLLEDGTAILYFNPQSSTLSNDQSDLIAGECNIIKTGEKVVMIDVGGTNRTASIKQYLEGIGVSKVDYLVITHYHPDHCGNIAGGNLLDLDWSGCVVYLPSEGSALSSEYATAQSFKAQCVSFATTYCESIVYPSEGDTLVIDKAKLTFLNCGATADAEIEAIQLAAQTAGISTQTYPLNDYSIVTKLEVGDAKALYTGDIQYAAEKRLCDNGLVGPVDLLKFPHHGDNSRRNLAYYIPFSDTVRARYVVVQEGSQNDQDRLRLEELNWGTDSVIFFPKLLPTVFTAYNSCIALASTDHVAKKVEHIVCDSGVNILGEGSDLNDLVKVGTYTIMSGAEAGTMLHTPNSDGAGTIGNSKLVVLHGSTDRFITQVLISGQDIFTRSGNRSGSTWSFGIWARMVKSIGNETVDGIKKFTSEVQVEHASGTFLRVYNKNWDRAIPPSTGTINTWLPMIDKNNNTISSIQSIQYADGELIHELILFNSSNGKGSIGIKYTTAGNFVGFCPSTPATGADNDIVTRDYLEARLAQL